MSGILMDGVNGNGACNEFSSSYIKEILSPPKSPKTPMNSKRTNGHSSQPSFQSDSGEIKVVIFEEVSDHVKGVIRNKENGSSAKKSNKQPKTQPPLTKSPSLPLKKSKKNSQLQLSKSIPKSNEASEKGSKSASKPSLNTKLPKKLVKSLKDGAEDSQEDGLSDLDVGPYLLKQARDIIASGDTPHRALQFALRAAKSFEKYSSGRPNLDLVMSLHVIAALRCSLGQYNEAIPVLKRSVEIPSLEQGNDHALAKFSSYMQLGDTYAILGQLESSIQCYNMGLEVQKQALGNKDPRVGETCRYLAEAYVQALQFDEAERLCHMALDIHREENLNSIEEIADRRLLGLICDTKGEHETALEHLVLASMAMMSTGQESEVASVDCSIGDTYLSLARYDEAVFAYQKALTVFKSTKGENHVAVASVFVRLASLYKTMGKFRESKSYCENALRIYKKPLQGTSPREIASGLTEIAAIYESMDEIEQAIKLLQKALDLYNDAPGQQSTIAGIEAQLGVLHYVNGNYAESYGLLKNAIEKLRTCGEKKSAFFGIVLNQMGLACLQQYAVNDAAEWFEEARSVLEQECGPFHPDTLGVCSNLAGAYDAMGRLDEAIELLDYVVMVREERLGTANPEVDDEKRRLYELLKQAGKPRHRKSRSLEVLLDTNSHVVKKGCIAM